MLNRFLIKPIKYILSFECFFTLFLWAGTYKTDPRLSWFPLDFTVFFFALSIFASLLILFRPDFKLNKNAADITLAAIPFFLFTILSLIWSQGSIYANEKTWKVGVLVFYCFIACAIIIASNPIRIKRFILFLLLISLWKSIDSFNVLYISVFAFRADALEVFGSDYIAISRVIGTGAVIVLCRIIFLKEKFYFKIIGTGVICFYIYVLLISGARGPIFALALVFFIIIGLIGFILVNSKKWGFSIKQPTLILLLVLSLIIPAIYFINSLPNPPRSIARIGIIFGEEHGGTSAGTRFDYGVASFQLWQKSPIWGHGIGSFPLLLGLGDIVEYPHNIILEILAEQGILGLVFFITLLVCCLSKLGPIREIVNEPLKRVIIFLFIFSLLNAFVSGDLSSNRIMFAFLGLMAFKNKPEINTHEKD